MSIENVIEKRIFTNGYIEGIKMYAVWINGEQFVGILKKPLKDVIDNVMNNNDVQFNGLLELYLKNKK